MDKTLREIQRLAARMGIENAKAVGGSPHGRLTGTYHDKPISLVISNSKGKFDGHRGLNLFRMNIKHAIRKIEEDL